MSRRWIVPAVIAVLLFTASLVHVEKGTWGVLRGVSGGRAFVLEPGLRFRIPFFQRLAVFPSGPFPLRFETEATSREGSRIRLRVHFEGWILRESLPAFSERAAGRNGPTLVEEDLIGIVTDWAAERSAGEIPPEPMEIRDATRPAAHTAGFEVKTLQVSTSPGPGAGPDVPSARAVPARGARVVLIGLDGADWRVLDPLIERGKTPVLARLKREGAWANLRSSEPMLSPLLWTTAATGRPPDVHGVVEFLAPDPGSTTPVPVRSTTRRVKALWNLFTEADRDSGVVGWWATYPAETIQGTIVSDRVAFALFGTGSGLIPPGAVFPADYASIVTKLRVDEGRISHEEIRPFVRITREELDRARSKAASDPALRARDRLLHLARILAATRTYHAVALDLLSRGQPDLLMVYYQGIDEVSHRFAHFAPPRLPRVSEQDVARFGGAVEAFYAHQDRLLGEILDRVDPASLVLVVSDHGFLSGPERPTDQPPDIEGQPARWHRRYGIFLARGPMVRPGGVGIVSLLDLAPIVLAASGLPAAADMPGRVPPDLFREDAPAARELPRVATYEVPGAEGRSGSAEPAPPNAAARRAEEAMLENLRALGYIGGGGQPGLAGGSPPGESGASGTAYSHASLAGLYLQSGRLEEASREAEEALSIAPGYYPALIYLAEIRERQNKPDAALELARRAAESRSPDRQSGVYLLMARLYAALGKPKEGIADLERFRAGRGAGESDLHAALGSLREEVGEPARAEEEYRRALAIDPASHEAVVRLYRLLDGRGEAAQLEPFLETALARNPRSGFHHLWIGLLRERTGRPRDAEASYHAALEAEPELVGALVNLGNLLARQKRIDEAIPFLRRAVEADPRHADARVALGAALGIRGDTREAVTTLEEGRRLGIASPALYNALAVAYYEGEQTEKAVATLRESLRLDPRQESVRRLLSQWEKR
jgi:tetratricopeptide (TPR) repeat protein/predicted AlkP superfamily pyrophosphatase or phosphodiesterase